MGQMKLILSGTEARSRSTAGAGAGTLGPVPELVATKTEGHVRAGGHVWCSLCRSSREMPPSTPGCRKQVSSLHLAALICMAPKVRAQAAPTLPGVSPASRLPLLPSALPSPYRREPAWTGTPSSCGLPWSRWHSCTRGSRRWCWW